MILKDLKKYNLPDKPGVYFFLKGKEILYIGKATSLKDRTRSYFASDLIKTRGPAILDMVTQSDGVKYEETDSVLEALILESSLIKKHKPRYNVKEKDDRSYNFIVVTDEDYPKIFTIRGRELKVKKNDKYLIEKNKKVKIRNIFGPFPNAGQLTEALKIIRKIFPYFDNKVVSKLNEQIGLTPDLEKMSKREYKNNVRNIELFFQGKKGKLITKLNTEMKKLAKDMEFEKANDIKKQIFALEHINDVSLISDEYRNLDDIRIESYDISHTAGKESVGVMVVMENGEFNKNEYRKFNIKEAKAGSDTGALKEVLRRRLNHEEWRLPKLFVIDGGKGQRNAALSVLKEYGYEIPVVSVVKDERHRPKDILGEKKYVNEYSKEIIKVNDATHRFAISFHRKKLRKGLTK